MEIIELCLKAQKLKKAYKIRLSRILYFNEIVVKTVESLENKGFYRTQSNISIIMGWLEEKKSYKKMLLFILAAYYGFDRTSIIEFCSSSWDIINFEKHCFKINEKNFP